MLLCRTVATGFGLDSDRLLAETPAPVFERWRLLYDLEPWGEERSDEAIGTLIGYVMAAHNIAPKAPAEYMRLLRGEPVLQSQQQMRQTVEGVCREMEKQSAVSGQQPEAAVSSQEPANRTCLP